MSSNAVRFSPLVALAVALAGCGSSELFAGDEQALVDAGAGGSGGAGGAGGAGGTPIGGMPVGAGQDAGGRDAAPTPPVTEDTGVVGDADSARPVPDAQPAGDAAAVPDPDAGPPVPDLPVCECFVRSAWCGEGAAAAGLARDVPCRVPLVPEHADDVLGCVDGQWVVQEACAFGCFAAPAGTPDHCNPDPNGPTPENPGWADCPHRPLLAWGLHPEASDRLRCAGVNDPDRVTQTIGNAAASAGYHAEDGRVDGEPYCAAVDLRARDLSRDEITELLIRLGENGFAAWYRWPGHDGWPADEAPHIHAVFAGVPMKNALEGQVEDFLVGLNGLASHSHYSFWEAPRAILDIIRLLFAR